MASYKLFRCWWKDYSANNSVFYDLSDSCKFSDLNWSAKLSNEPIEFSFSLSIPEVSNNPVYPEAGDEILFTTDSSKYQVVSNALYGIITDPGKSIISYDPLNARINYTYNVTVQQKDFSGYEVINQTWNNAYVSDILDNIMDYTTDGFLGGVTDNSTFTKYKLIAPDILITNFVSQDLTAREAIEKLCNENNLYYKMQYSSYPASTVNLKVISQIFILNQSGQAPPDTSSWGLTLDNTNLFKGLILNPLYAVNSTLPQYVASESGFTYSEDRDIIRNYIQLEAFATDDDPGNITFNRIIAGSSFQDTYILPYQAKDIVYVGVYSNYESYIKGTSATTTTTFYVPLHVAAILAVGNVVRIEYNSEFYLRTVSNVDTGTGQITLSEAMPAGFARAANVQLVIGEALEVVGNVTIYEDNQDTDLTTGVVKNIQLNEKAQIRFLENSIPSQGQVIVTGYYEVKNYKQSQFNHESIEKYGLRRHKETIANPLTRSQITEIFNSLLIPNPNVTISFYSDRIDLIEIGHQININIENFYTGSLICTAVKMQTISGVNWNNQQHIRQYITLSTLVEDLVDILKRITQSVKQYKPTGPENLKGKQSETVSILDSFTYVKEIFIPTDDFTNRGWGLWNGKTSMTGSGSSITSQEGNSISSSFQGSTAWSSSAKFTYGLQFSNSGSAYTLRAFNSAFNSSGVNFKYIYAMVCKFTALSLDTNYASNYSYELGGKQTYYSFFRVTSTGISLRIQLVDGSPSSGDDTLEIRSDLLGSSNILNTTDTFGFSWIIDLQNEVFWFIIHNLTTNTTYSTNSYTIRSAGGFYASIAAFKAAGGVNNSTSNNKTGYDTSVSDPAPYILYREVLKTNFTESASTWKDNLISDFENMSD
jgi:hypothetical protein